MKDPLKSAKDYSDAFKDGAFKECEMIVNMITESLSCDFASPDELLEFHLRHKELSNLILWLEDRVTQQAHKQKEKNDVKSIRIKSGVVTYR